jgi:imidazolonepropionase-like amidohydrolase
VKRVGSGWVRLGRVGSGWSWLIGLAGLIGLLSNQPGRAQPSSLAITGVTLIDGTDSPARTAMTVVVRDGRIAAITADGSARVPGDAVRVDGAGRFLIPALIDAHVHLTTRPEAEAPPVVLLPSLVAHGVLAVRDMGGDLDRLIAIRAAIAAGTLAGPAIITPGPFIDGPQDKSPTVSPVATPAEAAAEVRGLASRRVDFIKVQAGLTAELWRATLEAARAARLPVAGHVPEAMSAFDVVAGGQRSVEHVSPALPGDAGLMLSVSRDATALRAEMKAIAEGWARPEPDRAALRARNRELQRRLIDSIDPTRAATLFAAMREHDVTAVPTLAWSGGLMPRARNDWPGTDTLSLVPRGVREAWLKHRQTVASTATDADLALNESIARASIEFTGAMHRAGVTIAAGTDAFDSYLPLGPSLHAELENLAAAGFSAEQALLAGTRESARLLGMTASRGTVVAGKLADLVLLDEDPTKDIRATRKIHAVIQSGRLLERAVLDRMLADVRAAADR